MGYCSAVAAESGGVRVAPVITGCPAVGRISEGLGIADGLVTSIPAGTEPGFAGARVPE